MYHNLYILYLLEENSILNSENIKMRLPISDGKNLNSRLVERGS
jgi:hypothetical protein